MNPDIRNLIITFVVIVAMIISVAACSEEPQAPVTADWVPLVNTPEGTVFFFTVEPPFQAPITCIALTGYAETAISCDWSRS